MLILCEYCDIRCVCYDDWMEHLLSYPHQKIISEAINDWQTDLNDRSLVISINGDFKPTKEDICWYFASYGLVSDVFFEPDLEFCVIQLDKKDYAHNCIAERHHIQDAVLSLRLKSDITAAEWLSFNSMARHKVHNNVASKRAAEFDDRHQNLVDTLKYIPLEAQLDQFRHVVTMKSEEVVLQQKLLDDMKHIFRREYPKCFLCPYGSFVTGLGSRSSTLDIYFDAYGHSLQYGQLTESNSSTKKEILENFIKRVEKLNRINNFCHDCIAMPNAPSPYIEFTHTDTGVHCKFTFDSLLPVEASKLIDFILKLDPRLTDVFKFIRYWGEYHKLTGPNLISNYSLNLLLIVFLTKKKIVPSISVLQSMSSSTMEINGWDASYCTEPKKISNLMLFVGTSAYSTDHQTGNPTTHAILELASEFFKMYAHSDLQSLVVCPLMGELLPKSIFKPGNETQLPESLETYKKWASLRKPEARFNFSSLLCIQDPFDLSCNVSKKTPETAVWSFQFLCAETVENIENIMSSSDAKLMEIFKPLSSTKSSQSESNFEQIQQQPCSSSRRLDPREPTPKRQKVLFNYDPNSQVPVSLNIDNNDDHTTESYDVKYNPGLCYKCEKTGHFAFQCQDKRDNHWARARRRKYHESKGNNSEHHFSAKDNYYRQPR